MVVSKFRKHLQACIWGFRNWKFVNHQETHGAEVHICYISANWTFLKQFRFKGLKTMFSRSDKLLSNILELLFWIVHLQRFPGACEIRSRLSIPYRTPPIHPCLLLQFHLLFIPPASLTPGVYSSHIKYFAIPQHNISHPTNACHAVSFILNPLPSHSYPSSLIARLQLILYTVAPVSPLLPLWSLQMKGIPPSCDPQ